jgi:Leucine-rich repeat (LRR) protein
MSEPIRSLTQLASNVAFTNIEQKTAEPQEKSILGKIFDFFTFKPQPTPPSAPTFKEWRVLTVFLEDKGRVDHQTIKNIENSVLASKPVEVDANSHLQNHVMTLFRKLKQTYPLPLVHLPMEQTWEDEALQKTWNVLSKTYSFPAMNDIEQIRAWFCDPNNQVHLDGVQFISLYQANIKAIPPELQKCQNLMYLNCRVNSIVRIPDWIGNLRNLLELDLGFNQITTIPDSIGNLTNLKTLHLNNNQITTIADSIGNLTNLNILHLNNNQIHTLPDTMQNLSLRNFLASDNQIKKLPEWIGDIVNRNRQLQHFLFDNNQIQSLPESLKGLPPSCKFTIHNNRITYIPDWAKTDIFTKLNDSDNRLLNYTTNPDISIDLASYNISNTI